MFRSWLTSVVIETVCLWYRETDLSNWLQMSTYSRQKFSGLSWMVKRYYIQDYPENFRGNTEIRTIASDFIRPSIESSLTRRVKKTQIRHVVRAVGFLQLYKFLTWTGLENSSIGTKKYIYGSFWYFSMLYVEVFMLFLLPALS